MKWDLKSRECCDPCPAMFQSDLLSVKLVEAFTKRTTVESRDLVRE